MGRSPAVIAANVAVLAKPRASGVRATPAGVAPGPVQYVTLMTKSVFLPMFVGLINPRARP